MEGLEFVCRLRISVAFLKCHSILSTRMNSYNIRIIITVAMFNKIIYIRSIINVIILSVIIVKTRT